MSENETEHDEQASGDQAEDKAAGGRSQRRPKSETRDSDVAVRPGFRNPSNTRSKAQKKGRKKR